MPHGIETPSEIFRARTPRETAGRAIYIANGCVYCHSQSIRSIDWDLGAERIAQAGDYVADQPILLGSERTGPDLSQEGGEHPDDWHMAHFINPRYTRPNSIMPPFAFLGHGKDQAPDRAMCRAWGSRMRGSADGTSGSWKAEGYRRPMKPVRRRM